jgi:predicted cobalt transporter CbtA
MRISNWPHYNKAILTAVGFALTLATQVALPDNSPAWAIALQGVATALVVLLVPNQPKKVGKHVSQEQGTQPPASSVS